MRTFCFAKRSFKEIIRDPLSIIFAILLPLFLLFLFSQFDIPAEVYKIENFTPGIIIFSFSFISMFTATLVAKDRSTSLLVRLAVSPMRSFDYVLGYTFAVLPLALVQNLLFFAVALCVGLDFSIGVFYTVLAALPMSLLFIAFGILLGSLTNEKSSAGVSSIVVQLVSFTGGMWFDGEMVGDFFSLICDILPFSACTNILKYLLNGTDTDLLKASCILVVYTVGISVAAVLVFRHNMLNGNK